MKDVFQEKKLCSKKLLSFLYRWNRMLTHKLTLLTNFSIQTSFYFLALNRSGEASIYWVNMTILQLREQREFWNSISKTNPVLLQIFPEQLSQLSVQFSKYCCFCFQKFLMMMNFFIFFPHYSVFWWSAYPLFKRYIHIKPYIHSIWLWVQKQC